MMLLVLLCLVLVGGVVYFMVKGKSETLTSTVLDFESSPPPAKSGKTAKADYAAELKYQQGITPAWKVGDFPVDTNGTQTDLNTCKSIGYVNADVANAYAFSRQSDAPVALTGVQMLAYKIALDKTLPAFDNFLYNACEKNDLHMHPEFFAFKLRSRRVTV
jgi:hypothetical protein